MAKSRSIDVQTFLRSVHPDTLLRFLEAQGLSEAGALWLHMNAESLLAYAEAEENVERCESILDEIERVAEICRDGVGLVVRAHRRYGLDLPVDQTPGELAMLLYLHHPYAFDFAHSKYLLYGGGATLSVFRLAAEHPDLGDDRVEAFRSGVSNWYSAQDKGAQCLVTPFTDDSEFVLLIQRGGYLETRPIWEGEAIKPLTVRPAVEDVVTWDGETREVRLRTQYPRDRDEYLRLFADHMCGNEKLAQRAQEEAMFSLEPLSNGSFSFAGKGPINQVELREVKLSLHGVSRGLLTLRADNVREMLEYDTPGITLQSGTIISAKFRFFLQFPGQKRRQQMTFAITPPAQTNIGERRNVLVVLQYLEEQGVKLR